VEHVNCCLPHTKCEPLFSGNVLFRVSFSGNVMSVYHSLGNVSFRVSFSGNVMSVYHSLDAAHRRDVTRIAHHCARDVLAMQTTPI
jgi:hypothetical protein